MSFTSQPSTSVLHSKLKKNDGGTLIYEYQNTVVGSSEYPYFTIEYYINGSSTAFFSQDIDGFNSVSESGGDYTYTIEVDASNVVETFFNHLAFFFVPSSPYQNSALQASLFLKISMNGGSQTTSNTVNVLNSIVSDLSSYTTSSNRKLFTNIPTNNFYVLGEQYYLSAWINNLTVTHARFRTYDNNNTLLETIVVDLETVYSTNEVCVLSLKDSSIEGYTNELGANNIDISAAKYFIVDFGYYVDPIYTNNTEEKIYFVLEDVYRKKSFHFQNVFGCQETVVLFDDQHTKNEATSFLSYYDREKGNLVYRSEKAEEITINLKNLDNEDFNFLKEVLTSKVFYIDTDLYVPKGDISILTSDIKNQNDIKLTFVKSKSLVL